MVLNHFKYYLALMKPMIMVMSIFSSIVGMLLARMELSIANVIISNIGIAITVGSACAFNMYFERASDRVMKRTRERPLPSGKLSPMQALIFCNVIGIIGLSILFKQNTLLGIIGLLSLVFYVGPYTLLKRKSYFSVFIGMLPGAAPILMGWVAAGRSLEWPGIWLFFLVILWQIPHTLIIAHYLESEYKTAGIKTFTTYLGTKRAKLLAVISSIVLLIYTVAFPPFASVNPIYYVISITLGLLYIFFNFKGYEDKASSNFDKRIKNLSLVHLGGIFLGLML